MGGRGGKLGKKNGTPGNNQAQNRQVRSIKSALGLSKGVGRLLHDDINGMHMNYQEIKEEAKSMKLFREGKTWKRTTRRR